MSFSKKSYINRIYKLAEEHSDDVKIVSENSDGSICAKVPVSWIKVNPPRKGRAMTDEQKKQFVERVQCARGLSK